jgi:hypothetical protein
MDDEIEARGMPMPRAARFWDIGWINACRLT